MGSNISPYIVTGLDNRRNEKGDPKLTGGVDLFYQITPSLRSSVTINTDFAETEVDDRQINLTRFSLHFPEKRDFFLDGANYFQFGIEGDDANPVSRQLVRFFSGEEISYLLKNQYESLLYDFPIFNAIRIPKNDYIWWRHEASLKTMGARNIWREAAYGFGNFFNGTRKDIKLKANWKVAVPFFVGGTFTQNNVKLPNGKFTANNYQFNANILFSPDITLYNFVQYDNASRNVGWQSRFQWIVTPGNEIVIAWNSLYLQQEYPFYMQESTLRLKLKYNIRF